MTVKSKVGRPRYVVFRLSGRASRNALTQSIQDAGGDAARAWNLTVLQGNHGILRVPHTDKDRAIGALRRVEAPAKLSPLGTSGTIRAAKRKFLPAPEQAE